MRSFAGRQRSPNDPAGFIKLQTHGCEAREEIASLLRVESGLTSELVWSDGSVRLDTPDKRGERLHAPANFLWSQSSVDSGPGVCCTFEVGTTQR